MSTLLLETLSSDHGMARSYSKTDMSRMCHPEFMITLLNARHHMEGFLIGPYSGGALGTNAQCAERCLAARDGIIT
jgi:hypothetical protein